VGIGRSNEANVWVVHTAYTDETDRFITGYVYDDTDDNGRMDLGEGLPGITITVGAATVTSSPGGAWSVPVTPGTYRIHAQGPGFTPTTDGLVHVTEWNVGVELISGNPDPIIYGYRLCEGLQPTILGTSADDIITGTPGNDIIHGLGGNDHIDGNGGTDIICGDTATAAVSTLSAAPARERGATAPSAIKRAWGFVRPV
jgi:Ca2+-binding RTX toxin-like protein